MLKDLVIEGIAKIGDKLGGYHKFLLSIQGEGSSAQIHEQAYFMFCLLVTKYFDGFGSVIFENTVVGAKFTRSTPQRRIKPKPKCHIITMLVCLCLFVKCDGHSRITKKTTTRKPTTRKPRKPTMSPTNSPNSFCQSNNTAFKTAVDAYISQGCKTNSSCAIGATYGYPIGNWCTSSITIMYQLFYQKNKFNDDISMWDTSQVTNMGSMFYGASSFNQTVGSWNTRQVTNMAYMFAEASAFNQAVGSWNTSKVTTMNSMFYRALAFNQAVGSWDTSKVTTMGYMFNQASAFNQNLCQWRSAFRYDNAELIFTNSGCANKNAPNSSTQQNWCAVTTCTPS